MIVTKLNLFLTAIAVYCWVIARKTRTVSATPVGYYADDEAGDKRPFMQFSLNKPDTLNQKTLIIKKTLRQKKHLVVGRGKYKGTQVIIKCSDNAIDNKNEQNASLLIRRAKLQKHSDANLIVDYMKDFKIKNGHCFITRYQRGQGLDTYSDNMNPVKKGKTLPSIFKQIAKGVAYLESIGLSHGDLKPDNIIITNRGVDEGPKVTIIDFDLSSQLEYSWIGSLKPQAIPASSFQYRSPESFAHTKISLTKLHTWAIGACLYRCLTGRNPFQSILDNAKDYKEAYALYKQTMLAIIRYPNLLSGYITVPTDFITASTWNPLIGQMHKLMTVDPKERPNVSQYLTDLDENGVQT